MTIKVALAEDNDLLASSIEEKLELFSDEFKFCYRAENGKRLLEMLETEDGIDVILMDIEMPVMNGIEAAEKLKQKYPAVKVIMLTVFDDEENIFRSIRAGASGYLLKDETPDKIAGGIKSIMEGGAPMSPTIAAKSLELLRNPLKVDEPVEDSDYELTKRETEVLEELSTGLDYNQIAEKLFVSPKTVRKHIENIYKKLQVHNKIEAIQKARKHKLL